MSAAGQISKQTAKFPVGTVLGVPVVAYSERILGSNNVGLNATTGTDIDTKLRGYHEVKLSADDSPQASSVRSVITDFEKELGNIGQNLTGHGEALNNGLAMMAQAMSELRDAISRPKQIIRGKMVER